MKKICIIAFDYCKKNLKLQPWYYVHEIAKGLNEKDEVVIITNGSKRQNVNDSINDIEIINIEKISPSSTKLIKEEILKINPIVIIWWASRKSFLYLPLLKKLNIPIILLYSGPIYYVKEILTVKRYLSFKEIYPFLLEALFPLYFLKLLINSKTIKKIIVLTKRNKERLLKAGCKEQKIVKIPAGIDKSIIYKKSDKPKSFIPEFSDNKILYMGAATRIRGVDFLLKAFSKVVLDNANIKLQILARGATEVELNKLRRLCTSLQIINKVELIGGWLDKSIVVKYIKECKFLVMPFLLVHSEIPLSIVEAFAFGKPVIGTDLDGIPELIENRGVVYKHSNKEDLLNAIIKLSTNYKLYQTLSKNCLKYYNSFPEWEDIKRIIKNLIEEIN